MISDVKDRIRQRKPILKSEINGREEEIYSFLSGLLNNYPEYNKCPEYIFDSLRSLGRDYYARAVFQYAKLKSEIANLASIVFLNGSDNTISSLMNYCIDSYKKDSEYGIHKWLAGIFDQFFRSLELLGVSKSSKSYLFGLESRINKKPDSKIIIPFGDKYFDFLMAIEKNSIFFNDKTEKKLFDFYQKERLNLHSTDFIYLNDIIDFVLNHQDGYFPSITINHINNILSNSNTKFYLKSGTEIDAIKNIKSKNLFEKILLKMGKFIYFKPEAKVFASMMKNISNYSSDEFSNLAIIVASTNDSQVVRTIQKNKIEL